MEENNWQKDLNLEVTESLTVKFNHFSIQLNLLH